MLTEQLRAHLITWFARNLEELKETRLNTESMAEIEAALAILEKITRATILPINNALLDNQPELLTIFQEPEKFQPPHEHSRELGKEIRQYLRALCTECLKRLEDDLTESLTELGPIVSAVNARLTQASRTGSSRPLLPRSTVPPPPRAIIPPPTYPWRIVSIRPSSAPSLWERNPSLFSPRARSSTALNPSQPYAIRLPQALSITSRPAEFNKGGASYNIVAIDKHTSRNEIKLLLRFTEGHCIPSYISTRGIDSQVPEDVSEHYLWDLARQNRLRSIERASFEGAHFILFGGNHAESIAPWIEDGKQRAEDRGEQFYYIQYRRDLEGRLHPSLVSADEGTTPNSESTTPERAQEVLIQIWGLAIAAREERLSPRPYFPIL